MVQLSMDENQPPAAHYDIGRRLMPLRKEGVLVSFPLEGVDGGSVSMLAVRRREKLATERMLALDE